MHRICLTLLWSASATVSLAQPICPISEIARVGGEPSCISANGDIAIVTVMDSLHVVDVSDPANPTLAGEIGGVGEGATHRLAGSLAAVAVGDEFRIYDLSNPAAGTLKSVIEPIPGLAIQDRPAVSGDVAYLAYAVGPSRIVAVDISNPASPAVLDSIDGPIAASVYLSAAQDVVACTITDIGADHLVWIVDAAVPADLKSAATITSAKYAQDLACNGKVVCVFDGYGAKIYDVSNPYEPALIGGAALLAWYGVEIEIAGDMLYASVGYDPGGGGFWVNDLSDPYNPKVVGPTSGFYYSDPPISVAANDQGAVLLAHSALHTFEPLPQPGVFGTYPFVGRAYSCSIANDRLLIASSSGMHVFDILDPHVPVRVGSFLKYTGSGGGGSRVVADGDIAYFKSGLLHALDVSTGSDPELLSATYIQFLSHFDVDHGIGIAARSGTYGFCGLDLRDPRSPIVSPLVPLPTYPNGAAIEGSIALVSSGSVYVVDMSDPMEPQIVATVPGSFKDVAISGSYGFIGGVLVVDLTNPSQPVVIGSASPSGSVKRLFALENRLYAATHGSIGLSAFDVSNPASPALLGTFPAPNQALWVAADPFAYVALARGVHGLSLLRTCPHCPADCDASSTLDLFDWLCFVNHFTAGNLRADCDHSGALDIADFLCFVNSFNAGCP